MSSHSPLTAFMPAVLLAAVCTWPPLPAAAAPNVIVIVVDDLSWHDAYDAADLLRPTIDELAANGVRFTNGYATAPVCSPSRAGLLTGRYQQRFGHETNPGLQLEHSPQFGLPPSESTMGDRFKALGYGTGWIGKSHLGSQPDYHPNARGFDHFYGFLESHHFYVEANNPSKVEPPGCPPMPYEPIQRNGAFIPQMAGPNPAPPLDYLTKSFADEAVQFIDDRKSQEFFLYLPFNAVHFWLEGDSAGTLHAETAGLGLEAGSQRRLMAEVLLGLDHALAAILAKLRSHPDPETPGDPTRTLEDNTIIFLTSDNGGDTEFGGNNGTLTGRKTSLYEGGIRVPFIVYWKERLAVGDRNMPVSTLDILPTALAAAGTTAPAAWQLDGVNLLPELLNPGSPPARDLFWRVETTGISQPEPGVQDGLRAMRRGNWKLVKPETSATWVLYDLATPATGETANVADANPGVMSEMIAAYEAWNAGLARPRWALNDLQFQTPEFVPEDVRVGSLTTSYLEPEFLSGANQFAYINGSNALVRDSFDPLDGFPTLAAVEVDSGLSPLADAVVGPRWGLSAGGASLFYTKPGDGGRDQIWRALPGGPVALTTDPGIDSFGARVSRGLTDAAVKVAYNAGPVATWASTLAPATPNEIPDHPDQPANGQWIPGTADLAFASGTRIMRLKTDTGTSVEIADDPGGKSDVWAFHAPEYNHELCYAAVVDGTSISIYVDPHTVPGAPLIRAATLSLPAGSPPRFLRSMRPLDGLRGFNGTSYFSCAAHENADPQNPGESEMWLLGLGPSPNLRIARRVDTATGPGPAAPRTVVGLRDVHYYYTRNDGVNPSQLRLADTGVGLPDHPLPPTGFTSLAYQWSFPAAPDDIPLLGTETTRLVEHGGFLYAAQGSTGDPVQPSLAVPYPPTWRGAQILVKDSATGEWDLDETFIGHLAVESMESFTFTRSGTSPIPAPAREVLVAGLSDFSRHGENLASVRLRTDTGPWADSHPNNASSAFTSALGFHETVIDQNPEPLRSEHVFAGLSNGEIHRGVFLPGPPENLDWSAPGNPELSGTGPVSAFASANGFLYAACGLRWDAGDVAGGLYRRSHTGVWTRVYLWPGPLPLQTAPAKALAMTGLTAVPDPRGNDHQVLLGARVWPGVIERIDPLNNHAVTVELDVRDFFARRWNDESLRGAEVAIGYTEFSPATDPVTGEAVHLIGVWIEHPAAAAPPHNGTHFLIRHRDSSYEAADVQPDPNLPAGQTLRATRCIAASPFAADDGSAFYFGGYDSGGDEVQNTGWILRGGYTAWPTLAISQPDPPAFQLSWPATNLDWKLESSTTLAPLDWRPVSSKPVRALDGTTLSIIPGKPSEFFRLRKD